MAGHGGARAGSGRPMRELAKLATRLIAAFPEGYAIAGQKKGMVGPVEDVQRQVVANILADEILAGRGINVVRLEIDFMGKVAGKDDGDGRLSPLADALAKMPGLLPSDTQTPPFDITQTINADATRLADDGAPHSICGAPANHARLPFFQPQIPLDLDLQAEDKA